MRNLEKAQERWRPPRPWRSHQESEMIRRFVWLWLTCVDPSRPSGRDWARQLGISHTWLQKLVRQFSADPTEVRRIEAVRGLPTSAELSRAKEYTLEMKDRGELRPRRQTNE